MTKTKKVTGFKQHRGIRQGSSPSPLIFILALDYAIACYEKALEEENHKEISPALFEGDEIYTYEREL